MLYEKREYNFPFIYPITLSFLFSEVLHTLHTLEIYSECERNNSAQQGQVSPETSQIVLNCWFVEQL